MGGHTDGWMCCVCVRAETKSSYLLLAQVDGELNTLPTNTVDGKVWITQEGNNIIIQSSFGITVLYDTASYVRVTIPTTYRGQMCGLGGNFNGDKSDDFMMPNGKVTPSLEEFGASWKVYNDDSSCSDGCGEECPTCNAAQMLPYESEDSCGLIPSKSGPFKDCHSLVSPAESFKNCLHDMCVHHGTEETLCHSLQAYMAACQVAGGKAGAWRSSSFCCKFAN